MACSAVLCRERVEQGRLKLPDIDLRSQQYMRLGKVTIALVQHRNNDNSCESNSNSKNNRHLYTSKEQ